MVQDKKRRAANRDVSIENPVLSTMAMIRHAKLSDVPALQAIINAHAELGLMLFRSRAELYENIRDFFVHQTAAGVINGCAALEIVWADLAEVKSLAVEPGFQGQGIGGQLLAACIEEARSLELERVFALTYEQQFFERFGFAIVEKDELPHKVWTDCIKCPKRPGCDEIAMLLRLDAVERASDERK